MKFRSLKQLFEPYKDVIIFMVTLLVANYFWKWTMVGDEDGAAVLWLEMDVTAPFVFMAHHIARVVYELVALFRDTVMLIGDRTIGFESGTGTTIIWGCTGLKQAFIFLCLIATVPPIKPHTSHLKFIAAKLCFVLLGWIACYAFNILRIFLIALAVEHHPEWFHVLHDYLFKYLFYGMLFGLWVIFVEKIRASVSAN